MSDFFLDDCNCCEGLRTHTPAEITNPPGLSPISYRVGTYNQFKQSMLVRLSAAGHQALSGLNTRSSDDFSIALLDTWAVVCDVLTFYQERIANESYARTATEYLSLLQIANSASYKLQPGVAADTYLAFTLESTPGSPGKAIIDIGTKAQSLPDPGESPQVFETIEAIEARSVWNAIQPRKTRPQLLSIDMPSVLLQGTTANLHPGDVLLLVVPDTSDVQKPFIKALRFVQNVVVDNAAQQTRVILEDIILTDAPLAGESASRHDQPLSKPSVPTISGDAAGDQKQPVAVSTTPVRSLSQATSSSNGTWASMGTSAYSNSMPQTLDNATVEALMQGKIWKERNLSAYTIVHNWSLQDVLTNSVAQSHNGSTRNLGDSADVTGIFVFRMHASLFGNTAPDWQIMPDSVRKTYFNQYQKLNPSDSSSITDFTDWPFLPTTPSGSTNPSPPQNVIDLDRTYPQILPWSWVAVKHPAGSIVIAQVDSTTETSVVNHTLSGKVTRLSLSTAEKAAPASMQDIRQMIVYGQSDKLALAELPIDVPVQGNSIDVHGLYDGLPPGKTLMIMGELSDLDGVQTSEAVVLAETAFDASYLDGLTTLTLKSNLANAYKPETVTIYANVARATQGETVRDEILGNGVTSQPYQRFTLRQGPLTYLHNTMTGELVSTLQVYVNDIQWQEVSTLLGHGPRDRVFVTYTDEDGKTTVQFGDGQKTGARLPDGQENIRATYRKGSGTQGHVNANQITQLMTRPLGVKSVNNPQAPIGAEDPETTDNARSNAALTVLTLNRIVSVADYVNFARSFSGVAKVLATMISTSRVRGIFVTLAGSNGREIEEDDPLYIRIFFAMQKAGDPTIPLKLQSYRKALFRIAANIKLEADVAQADVLERVQITVHSYFSFANRSFGQAVTLKEVINVIQDVPGVVTASVYNLYRLDDAPALNTVLHAAIPTVGTNGIVSTAELLLVDTVPFDALEVIS